MNKKIIVGIIGILLVVIIGVLLVKGTKKYTVTFETDGGTKIEAQKIKNGDEIEEPEIPTKDGYIFEGWYVDGKEYDFTEPVSKDTKIVAKWKKIEKEESEEDKTKEDKEDSTNTKTKNISKSNNLSNNVKNTETIKEEVTTTIITTKTITSETTTTTSKKEDVITYLMEDENNSVVGQIKLYITKNGKKVNGTCDITTKSGTTVTKTISKDGYVTNKNIITKIENIKVN